MHQKVSNVVHVLSILFSTRMNVDIVGIMSVDIINIIYLTLSRITKLSSFNNESLWKLITLILFSRKHMAIALVTGRKYMH